MFNYIKGELYRIFCKKSFYIYLGSVFLIYVLLNFIRLSQLSESNMFNDAEQLLQFLPFVIGGYVFAAVYVDDLHAKNLITLVGFGFSKANIILAKFVLVILLNGIIFALAPLFMWISFAIFGIFASGDILQATYMYVFKFFLMTVAFSALSGILIYGLQRQTWAVTVYMLLAIQIISNLLIMFTNKISTEIANLTILRITDNILLAMVQKTAILGLLLGYLTYVAVCIILSIIAFNKKELEF